MDPKRRKLARRFQIIIHSLYGLSGISLGYILAGFAVNLLALSAAGSVVVHILFIGAGALCAWRLAREFVRETLPLEFFMDQE